MRNTKAKRFLETGTEKCIHHGIHSEWSIKEVIQKGYHATILDCKRCSRNRTKEWNKRHPGYQDDFRYSRNGIIARALAQARRRSKDKKLSFSIDKEWLQKTLETQKGCCAYSGLSFDWERPNGHPRYRLISIDQKIPGKGYDAKNCVLVCWGINLMKNEMSLEEFRFFCKAISDKKDG